MLFDLIGRRKRIYLDHAAATPVRAEVLHAMRPYFRDVFGNPSAIHAEGVAARKAVEEARTSVARTLRVRATDVTFTSGGTESNNLALRGTVDALMRAGIPPDEIELISLATEHPSILKTLEQLTQIGCVVTYVPIKEDGRMDMHAFEKALSPKTRIVSVAYANSETGIIQDLGKIGRVIAAFEKRTDAKIVIHTDASQAPLWLPCELERLHVEMMTLDAGKFGGAKGVGALIHRPRTSLAAVTHGGSQEHGLRAGTENVPLIVGFASALELAQAGYAARSERVRAVRDRGIEELTKLGVVVNGSLTERLANNINISIPGVDTEYAVIALDAKGIACATKSACSGAGGGISSVVFAMTGDEVRAKATIRMTLGEETTVADLKQTTVALQQHLHLMHTMKS